MKLLRRGIFRNLYLLVCFSLFALCLYTASRGNEWRKTHKKLIGNLKLRSHDIGDENIGDAVLKAPGEGPAYQFPDSKLMEGSNLRLVDWHNYTQEEIDRARKGPGEQGVPFYLRRGLEKEREALFDTNGFNALLSDSIPLDRALPDIRHHKCREKKYSEQLPTVSVVIPFFEEHWTTLLRTVVSVMNRSPPHLLKQIILVDDGSTMESKDFLRAPLDKWLRENCPKGMVVRLPKRVGLIVARQEGARRATGDVIVVLDSHVEVMINWLPPLLDPILSNHRTAVCPLIDVVNQATFAYAAQDHGGRGAFDWRFYYKRLNLRPHEREKLPDPFPNPVMNGGLFAISRDFFWELGGYDDGLAIWGGEQYNLSFKIWLCGGRMFDAPCSRVGHIFRHAPKGRPSVKEDFLSRNYKRVATVWMGEYAEALYRRNPRLHLVDPGDISKEIEIREKLQCKSFKWFLEKIAPDLLAFYPPVEPPDYANGTIQSLSTPSLCLDNGAKETGEIIMYPCHGGGTQFFALSWRKTIKVDTEQFCWEMPSALGQAPFLSHCQNKKPVSNQIWRYDPTTKQIQSKGARDWCLEANSLSQKTAMAQCNPNAANQRWNFKFINTPLIASQFPPF